MGRKRRIVLGGGAALCHSDSGGDDERTVGAKEHGPESLNGALVDRAVGLELREVVDKGG
jgi:hypothetical protein